jgi:hypothetical protein
MKIPLTKQDLDIINSVVQENNLERIAFDLVYDAGSGIGYTLDLEYATEVHGREVTIRVPIVGVENW